MKQIKLFIILVIVTLGVYFLVSNLGEIVKKDNLVDEKEELVTDTINTSEEGVVVIDIIARQFSFSPDPIIVKLGDRVKLNINSIDIDHGFALPDFNIDARLEAGKITTVEFEADKLGEFIFSCSVFCGSGHREMTGVLIVE
jgi:heme/copper-type cytochrome/quinol oxidase subunit 2